MNCDDFGIQSESEAARYLECVRGWRVIGRRVRFREGELDLIMETGEERLVFVEVKARRSFSFGAAVEGVTFEKVRRLKRAVSRWRREAHEWREGELLLLGMEWRNGVLTVDEVPIE